MTPFPDENRPATANAVSFMAAIRRNESTSREIRLILLIYKRK
jgi:hypothetical protein